MPARSAARDEEACGRPVAPPGRGALPSALPGGGALQSFTAGSHPLSSVKSCFSTSRAMMAVFNHNSLLARSPARASFRALCQAATTETLPAASAVQFSTTESIPGRSITAYHGIAQGSTVRTKNVGHDFLAGGCPSPSVPSRLLAGSLAGVTRPVSRPRSAFSSYTELLREARAEAMDRIARDAASKGANAVVSLRLVSSSVSAGASEILAYGTAVTVK
eukprot:scaffold20356_cov125-Isochrysis_galbana.AAC.5